jgi:hypothetical protein
MAKSFNRDPYPQSRVRPPPGTEQAPLDQERPGFALRGGLEGDTLNFLARACKSAHEEDGTDHVGPGTEALPDCRPCCARLARTESPALLANFHAHPRDLLLVVRGNLAGTATRRELAGRGLLAAAPVLLRPALGTIDPAAPALWTFHLASPVVVGRGPGVIIVCRPS